MRSIGFTLALAMTLLPRGAVPSEAVAQQTRPRTSPVQYGMGTPQPEMLISPSPKTASSPASQTPSDGTGTYGASSWGYSAYQILYGMYDSPSSSDAASQASQVPRLPTADDVEVSGPLDTPPPRRAIVRLRLPDVWADVGFDGQKVDSMGRSRTFVTPELSGTRKFEVTATWKHKGRTVWVMEQVTVKAGQIRTLDFTSGN
jgi:uncharacterized protein (TIGR03000 family)